MRVAIRKVGDCSAVVLPKTLLGELGVADGDELAIAIVDGRIILAPLDSEARAACARAAKTAPQPRDEPLSWREQMNNEDEPLDDRAIRRL